MSIDILIRTSSFSKGCLKDRIEYSIKLFCNVCKV